jgi:GAF domain-containing protein
MDPSLQSSPSSHPFWRQIWNSLIDPSPAIQDVAEQRVARLAASFLLTVAVFEILGGVARFAMAGRDLVTAFSGGIGFTLVPTLIAYGISRTKAYRVAIFIFAVAYGFAAYTSMVLSPNSANVPLLILIYVPLSLVIASAFLSWPAVFLLTGLNVAALYATRFLGVSVPDELAVEAAMITIIGIVLILLARFRNNLEKIRLQEVQRINRDLEDIRTNLEHHVSERTAELEQVNRFTSRRATQLQTITELSEAILQLQDLSEIFPAITTLISERFGFYHVGIFLIDSEREYAVLQAANSEGGQRMLARSHRLRLGTGIVGFAAQTGEPRIALDVGSDAVYFDNPDLPNTHSEAALPMKSRGETTGVLDVQSTETNAFSNDDLQVLTALANQVSIALENARLLTETRTALAQVQNVYDEFTRAEWSRTIAKAEQPGFRYNTGRIEMLETEIQSPEVRSAAVTGEIVASQANGSDEKRPTVAVPVKLRGEVIGVIQIESNDPSKTWHEDEVSLVQAVAERVAFAMESTRLFQDARRRAAKEQAISAATARISGAISIENILHATAEELERVLGGSEVLIQFQGKE